MTPRRANSLLSDCGIQVRCGHMSDNYPRVYRRAAGLVDRILKGASPATLPVEQPTEFEFVVNLRTAKSLRIELPQSVLLQATRVIE